MALATIPRLYVIADRDFFADDEPWLDAIETLVACLRGPGEALRLRVRPQAHDGYARERFEKAAVRLQGLGARVPVLGGRHSAEALELGFDGVHWAEARVPHTEHGVAAGERLLTGASVHGRESLVRAELAGADFVLYSPVFAPSCKDCEGVGPEELAAVAQSTSLPVLALGGMTPARAALCMRFGAHGVGLVSGVLASPDPGAAIQSFRDAMSTGYKFKDGQGDNRRCQSQAV